MGLFFCRSFFRKSKAARAVMAGGTMFGLCAVALPVSAASDFYVEEMEDIRQAARRSTILFELESVERRMDKSRDAVSPPPEPLFPEKLSDDLTIPLSPPGRNSPEIIFEVPEFERLAGEQAGSDLALPAKPDNRNAPSSWYKADIELGMAQRTDTIDWSIAGDSDGMNPNISIEEKWNGLRVTEFKGKGQVLLFDHIVIDGKASYGWITDGNNREAEYLSDNRTNELSGIETDASDGNTLDLSVGVGYLVSFTVDNEFLVENQVWDFDLTFLGGYSYHEQNLIMTDGVQVVDPQGLYGLGPFPGLDNRYETAWNGPWLGLELEGRLARFSGLVRAEYHWADYYAEGVFNLRTDLRQPGFNHFDEGTGLVLNFGIGYDLNQDWKLNLMYELQDWKTDGGKEELYYTDGTTEYTRLNEVNWDSYAVTLATTCRFPLSDFDY